METLGQKLKYLRKEAGLTQTELAEIFFVDKSTIAKYETDKIDVSATDNSEKPEERCNSCIISSNTGLSVSLNSTIKILPTTAPSFGY